jgi:hypothetical protein
MMRLEDTNVQVIIIDSVQPLYSLAWNSTISSLSEEARLNYSNSIKIGAYLFPVKQLGFNVLSKIDEFMYLPNDDIRYPDVNLELAQYSGLNIDIGTGLINNIPNIIDRYLKNVIIPQLNQQFSMIELINMHGNISNVIDLFPKGLIERNTEFNDDNILIEVIKYKDGMQIFNGPSRDYRGEVLLLDKNNNKWHLLRGSLPVFPDYCTIEKDPGVFPYIYDILDICMPNRKNWFQYIKPCNTAKYYLTYKHDGSLFNLTFIPNTSKVYNLLIQYNILDKLKNNLIIKNEYGILFFGSKGRLSAANSNPVRTRITNSIIGSYGSIENFEYQIIQYLINHELIDEQITLHFEAIDEIPTSELTVYYGKAFCPFLGYTIFSDLNKQFYLPDMDEYALPVNTPIYKFNNWNDILEFSKNNYDKLLKGDLDIEPEGYVIHIIDEINNKWFPVKLKYEFYYIAHKPNSKKNQIAAKNISENDEYSILRNRLSKFRDKPSIESCIYTPLLNWYNNTFPISNDLYIDKRTWAIYWSSKKKELEESSNIIYSHIKDYYPAVNIKLFDILMRLFPTISFEDILNRIIS